MKLFHVIVREINSENRAHHVLNAETDLIAGQKALEYYHGSLDYTVEKIKETSPEQFAKDTAESSAN